MTPCLPIGSPAPYSPTDICLEEVPESAPPIQEEEDIFLAEAPAEETPQKPVVPADQPPPHTLIPEDLRGVPTGEELSELMAAHSNLKDIFNSKEIKTTYVVIERPLDNPGTKEVVILKVTAMEFIPKNPENFNFAPYAYPDTNATEGYQYIAVRAVEIHEPGVEIPIGTGVMPARVVNDLKQVDLKPGREKLAWPGNGHYFFDANTDHATIDETLKAQGITLLSHWGTPNPYGGSTSIVTYPSDYFKGGDPSTQPDYPAAYFTEGHGTVVEYNLSSQTAYRLPAELKAGEHVERGKITVHVKRPADSFELVVTFSKETRAGTGEDDLHPDHPTRETWRKIHEGTLKPGDTVTFAVEGRGEITGTVLQFMPDAPAPEESAPTVDGVADIPEELLTLEVDDTWENLASSDTLTLSRKTIPVPGMPFPHFVELERETLTLADGEYVRETRTLLGGKSGKSTLAELVILSKKSDGSEVKRSYVDHRTGYRFEKNIPSSQIWETDQSSHHLVREGETHVYEEDLTFSAPVTRLEHRQGRLYPLGYEQGMGWHKEVLLAGYGVSDDFTARPGGFGWSLYVFVGPSLVTLTPSNNPEVETTMRQWGFDSLATGGLYYELPNENQSLGLNARVGERVDIGRIEGVLENDIGYVADVTLEPAGQHTYGLELTAQPLRGITLVGGIERPVYLQSMLAEVRGAENPAYVYVHPKPNWFVGAQIDVTELTRKK